MAGNLCNTIVIAILNRAPAHLNLECYTLKTKLVKIRLKYELLFLLKPHNVPYGHFASAQTRFNRDVQICETYSGAQNTNSGAQNTYSGAQNTYTLT